MFLVDVLCGLFLLIVFFLLLNFGWFLWVVIRSCRYIDFWGRYYNGFFLVFFIVFYFVTGMFYKFNGCFVFFCNEFNVICFGIVCCCINIEYILKCDLSFYNGIFWFVFVYWIWKLNENEKRDLLYLILLDLFL